MTPIVWLLFFCSPLVWTVCAIIVCLFQFLRPKDERDSGAKSRSVAALVGASILLTLFVTALFQMSAVTDIAWFTPVIFLTPVFNIAGCVMIWIWARRTRRVQESLGKPKAGWPYFLAACLTAGIALGMLLPIALIVMLSSVAAVV